VQFFDTPVTRAWVAESLVKDFGEKVAPGQDTDDKWKQGESICWEPCNKNSTVSG